MGFRVPTSTVWYCWAEFRDVKRLYFVVFHVLVEGISFCYIILLKFQWDTNVSLQWLWPELIRDRTFWSGISETRTQILQDYHLINPHFITDRHFLLQLPLYIGTFNIHTESDINIESVDLIGSFPSWIKKKKKTLIISFIVWKMSVMTQNAKTWNTTSIDLQTLGY